MAYNTIFGELPIDLHTIICRYNRKAIFALPKDRLMTYKWKYLIKAVFGFSYDLPINEMILMYDNLSKSKNIYSGYAHTIIRLSDGTLMACGYNGFGQLGLGDRKDRPVFEEIKDIPKNVVNVGCGYLHTIIRLSDGTLMACGFNGSGFNGSGELGLGDTKDRLSTIIFEVIKNIPKNVVDIVCGEYHTIIRLSDGTLMASGNNCNGQLGLGDTKSRSVFEEISGIPKNVVGISCRSSHTTIRLSDGTLMTCGLNNSGQLGLGDTNNRSVFEEIKNIPKNVVGIMCGGYHTIIRLSDGTLMTCGNNYYGQLGFGDTKKRLIFEEIKDIPKNIVDVSCGHYHTIIRQSNGTLMACGYNYYGQLGFGNKNNRLMFEVIKDIPKNVIDVSCSNYHTVIRLSNGTLLACGHDYNSTKFKKIKGIPKKLISN